MMNMEHRQTQSQRQTQQLVLTQKMQQALHILQLSGVELEQFVQQELETNPFLDQVQKKEDPPPVEETGPAKDENERFEENFDLDSYSDSWDLRRKEGQDLSFNRDLDARRQHYEDSITQEESLRAYMQKQLQLSVESAQDLAIGERIIIGDIDDRGYFTGDTALIAEEMGVDEAAVQAVLAQIRRFEPTGLGARNIVDCLLMQIEVEHPNNEALKILVRDHLEELSKRQLPQIARAMKIKPDVVETLKNELAQLNPFPGHAFSSTPAQYITPEVVVEKVDDDFRVRLVGERMPDLRINNDFHKSVRKQAGSSDDKEYMRQKMESANWLKRNIEQRQETILKVSQAIVDVQKEFFEKGVEMLRPLTLQNIADVVGVHESTVARTTRGKYMQTPQGLFELKYFFSPGLSHDHGEAQASKSVQAQIKTIIEQEDKHKPLSDQKIADLLKKEGVNVARRTVTKYREALGIPKTSMRKEY